MSITQLSQTSAGTTDFTLLKDEVTKNAKGINQITLSNYDNDSAPVVKVGSVFENDGATFEVRTSDESPTGYSGISNSTTFFLYFDASATAFIYDSTAPTWDDAKQGYYHPTNTTDRAFFTMFKDSGGTLYENKSLLIGQNNYQFPDMVKLDEIQETTSGGGINLTHRIRPSLTDSGSWSVGTGGTVIPRGIYQMRGIGNGAGVIEMFVSGSWRSIYDGTPNAEDQGGLAFSDGTNVRVRSLSGTITVYYQRY